MNKCIVCGKRIDHPVRRGPRAKFCGEQCRDLYTKNWRREYDAQPWVRGKKAAREMAKYRKAKTKKERTRLERNRIARERRMQASRG